MKKKILSIFSIIMIVLSYCNYTLAAIAFSRTGGRDINGIATYVEDDTYVDSKYDANSKYVKFSDIEIYDYNSTTKKQATGNGEAISYEGNQNKYFYYLDTTSSSDHDYIEYAIKIGTGSKSIQNIATFIYKDAITYYGETYDLKINLKKIEKEGNNEQIISVRIGSRNKELATENNKLDTSTYTDVFSPTIHAAGSTSNKTEATIEYIVIDDSGKEVEISGLFGITDIDLNQGVFIDYFKATKDNIYMKKKDINTIYYKESGNGTYIYSTTDANNDDHNVYALIDEKSKLDLTFTFDTKGAASGMLFYGGDRAVKLYKKIITSAIGGTITPNITNIKNGDDETVTFAPTDATKQYLKSITVDEEEQEIVGNEAKWEFNDIVKDHKIAVVYADKLKVTFDPKGGSPTPATQYVIPNDKATQPTTSPTKPGYTFSGWSAINPSEGTPQQYDFNKEVEEDITLYAMWTPIVYNINYVLDGGTNDSTNPSTYTTEDTVDFKNPTKEGYDFKGWYSNEALTTSKDGIAIGSTGNVTVYAKWQAKSDTPYEVEHYKENDDGEYELAVTDSLTGNTDETVTATPKEYEGFVENTTYSERVNKGTIAADGSLVLKLYYDKEKYTVTFDTKGGSPKPSNQTVKYGDLATEPNDPTRDGYEFEYWYYINEDGEEVRYNFDDPVISNVNLIAKWEAVVTPATNTGDDTALKDADLTVANTPIPQTGELKNRIIVAISVVVLIGVLFGIGYFRLRDIK